MRPLRPGFVLLFTLACVPDPPGTDVGNTPIAGTEGGPCRADGTCDAELTCASNLCVRLPGNPDAGAASGSGGAASGSGGAASGSGGVASGSGGAGSGSGGTSGGASGSSGGMASSGGASSSSGGAIVTPAVARCAIESVNGNVPAGTLRANADVIVTAADVDAPSGETVAGYAWAFHRMPPGSRAALQAPGAMSTGFISGNGPGLDVSGTYVLDLVVTFSGGASASSQCSLEVRPSEGLSIELTWDAPTQDVDLHLMKASAAGRYCSPQSSQSSRLDDCDDPAACYYANCKSTSFGLPEWDAANGASDGDPTLLIDDVAGYGPEQIIVPAPVPGDYLVGVHHFSDHGAGATRANVRVYLGGELRASYVRSLADGSWWDAVLVHWQADGQVCIEDASSGVQTCGAVPSCTPVGSCEQCDADTACGPGLTCNLPTNQCAPSLTTCTSNNDCVGEAVCATAYGTCIVPQCTSEGGCTDERAICATTNLACVLPPAVCAETDEPNDTPDDAVELTLAEGIHSGAGILCRGNVDYLSFPLPVERRAIVTVTEDGPDATEPVEFELLAPGSDAPVASGTTGFSGERRLAANLPGTGTGYVRVRLPHDAGVDDVTYTVTVELTDPLTCDGEPGEPNNTPDAAGNSVVVEGVSSFVLCGEDDDHHTYEVSPNSRVRVTAESLGEDDVDLALLDLDGSVLAAGSGAPPRAHVDAGAAGQTIIIHVRRGAFSEEDPLAYLVTIEEGAIPICDDETSGTNNLQDDAYPLSAGTYAGVACDRDDLDWFTFELGSTSDITLRLTSEADIDLDLYLYDDVGQLASAASTVNPELIEFNDADPGRYWVRMRPYAFGEEPYPTAYNLELVAPGIVVGGGSSSSAGAGSSSSLPASSSTAGSSSSGGTSSSPGTSSTVVGAASSSGGATSTVPSTSAGSGSSSTSTLGG